MFNDEYDIEKAFKSIEDELMASMMRNMGRHQVEELAEGYNWDMWQVRQLEALEKYKKRNKKKFQSTFSDINSSIDSMIKAAHAAGSMNEEIRILNAIKKGANLKRVPKGVSGEFFKLNTRKLDALANATKKDFIKAEQAMLRQANDQYRKIIYNAQVYANTGAGTYEQAVDMATKDFLSRGITCIEYANGTLHNMQFYSKMAIRTANKRAYLTGEGEKRQEWGEYLVRINKRGNACPKCLPFVGKVLIDDVWSGGSAEDGDYPLMSRAIQLGLYHPNCKDVHSTYFEGISEEPEPYTAKELQKIQGNYKADQEQQYAKRQAEKYGRLEQYSLDPNNKRVYGARKEEWSKKFVAKFGNDDIIKTDRLFENRKMANGNRVSPQHILSKTEIDSITEDAKDIGIPTYILNFNIGSQTGYSDLSNVIHIRGDVLPDVSSVVNRDLLSQKAVLAHEYYGHYLSNPSKFRIGDWRDEFQASYKAAINTPNLSDAERRMLMLDAYDRAKEAGVVAKYNKKARMIIYGYE